MLNKKNIDKLITPEIKIKYKLGYKCLAMFLAQCDHESMGFTRVRENLNYSAEALKGLKNKEGKRYFTDTQAERFGRTQSQPAIQQMIGNIYYGGRMGNDIFTEKMFDDGLDYNNGDGWLYRGGGNIQITGKDMYILCSEALGIDFVKNPNLIGQPQNANLVSLWYWDINNCNDVVDDIEKVTKIINVGCKGLEQREALYKKYLIVLKS